MNDLQIEAIEYINGPLLVLAGAGSGKTTILTQKVHHLATNHGTPLDKIIVLTFTNKAVSHFKSSLFKIMPNVIDKVRISTFHELGRKVIQEQLFPHFTYVNEYLKRQIIEEIIISISKQIQFEFKQKEKRLVQHFGFIGNESELFSLMKEKLSEEQITKFLKMHTSLLEKKKSMESFLKPTALSQLISKFKSELFLPTSFIRPEQDIFSPYQQTKKINEIIIQQLPSDKKKKLFLQIFTKYQIQLKEKKAVDYEDMMLLPIKTFLTNPFILEEYQKKWDYMLIDEYQDTNQLQYLLVKLLSQKSQNLCVVGDDYQTIYRFRGSDYKKIMQFQNDFANTKLITLEQNFRNSKCILGAANELIKHNKGQHHKNLYTDSTNEEPIYVHHSQTFMDEANWVSQKVNELLNKGHKLSDMAVLYRHNSDAKLLESKLSLRSIPYQISNEKSIFDSKDIHYMIRYFSFLNEPTNSFLFQYTIAYFYPNIQKRTIMNILKESLFHENFLVVLERFLTKNPQHSDKESLLLFIQHMNALKNQMNVLSPNHFIQFFLSLFNMSQISQYHRKSPNDYLSLKSGRMIEHLIRISSLYEKIYPTKSTHEFLHFLKNGDVQSWYELYQNNETLQLMTIHSSKGLEFPIVFLIGFQEGIFPSPYAQTMDDIEEERRLCYVAFTRTKDLLFLSYTNESPSSLTDQNTAKVSRFFHEFSHDYICEI